MSGLKRHSLREDALRVIRAQIISGALLPGTLYQVGQITEQLEVSATPVREALLDLAKEGMVEMVRNRGFRIRTMTDRDLDEIVQLRLMLEPAAVHEITVRQLVTDFSILRELAAQTEDAAIASDWVRFLDTDRELHLVLLGHLDNARLQEIVGQLRDQSRLYGLGHIAGTDELLRSTREHDELLDAIEAGDADRAASIMTQHVRHARGVWAGRTEASERPEVSA